MILEKENMKLGGKEMGRSYEELWEGKEYDHYLFYECF